MMNYPTKENQMTIKKRGRPLGVKNKPNTKAIKEAQILSFHQQLKEWDRKENTVDYKELCDKLQEALAKSYVDADNLNKSIDNLSKEIRARDIIITYLEIRRT
jgi:UDP-glucose 6-dehydrogenase